MKKIHLPPEATFKSVLAQELVRLKIYTLGRPRRPFLDDLCLVYSFDGRVFNSDGSLYEIPEVDEVINSDRYISLFLETDTTGLWPRRIVRKHQVLKFLWVYLECLRISKQ